MGDIRPGGPGGLEAWSKRRRGGDDDTRAGHPRVEFSRPEAVPPQAEARAQVAAALLVRRLLDDRLRGAVLVDASFEWRTPQIEPAATTMARTADRAPIEPFSEAAAAATTTTLLR